MATHAEYPVRVEAQLDPHLSRWLWLVKWFLAIPHFFVLAFLWVGFAVMSVAAFFAILFTGRYPRGIFEYNVGVLRWSWRVSYYSYGALGTDRYPPFTLKEVPAYPAHFEVAYPEHLSRGLVLVKWWLLAIPHYLIVGLFLGGAYLAVRDGYFATSGLIEVLALIAAVILLFTGKYPQSLFDLVLGLNRWVLRVAAYAGLMTDAYPPFRLDQGGSEKGGTMAVDTHAPPPALSGGATRGWSAGAVISVIAGALATLLAVGLLAGGGVLLWADRTQRNDAGFVTSPERNFATPTAALVVDDIDIRGEGPDAFYPSQIIGDAQISIEPRGDEELFIGVARAAQVDAYLAGSAYGEITDVVDDQVLARDGDPSSLAPPSDETFWAHATSGAGLQTLRWEMEDGRWSVVVMNADASEGVSVRAEAGAEFPALPWIALGLLVAGLVVGAVGVLLIVLGNRSAGRPAQA